MKQHKRSITNGFTLIEVMIAMAIFAILAVLSYTGLQSVITSKTGTEAELERLQQLQITMLNLTTDLQQLSNRDGHDSLGGKLHRLSSQNSDYLVEFTRSGWRNPADQPRSTLQRVAYQLDEDRLLRIYWRHVDRADEEDRVERDLMDNVKTLQLRYLDDENQWQDNWPSAMALTTGDPVGLPVAIEIELEMEDWGKISRIIEVVQ